jgi:hypothetical protein
LGKLLNIAGWKNKFVRAQVVGGKSLDSVFMVMEFMEHDLKQLMEDMPHPFTVAEVPGFLGLSSPQMRPC